MSRVGATLMIPWFAFWATLMRALFVRAQLLPPTCARCGLRYERRALGEVVCSCGTQLAAGMSFRGGRRELRCGSYRATERTATSDGSPRVARRRHAAWSV